MPETDSADVQKQIGELEDQYKEWVIELNKNNLNVSASEKKLLKCLQQLMPLQNAYLTSLIRLLQSQIEELKNPNPDNVDQPTVSKPGGVKLEVIDEDSEEILYNCLNPEQL
jgi:hypothetical protein